MQLVAAMAGVCLLWLVVESGFLAGGTSAAASPGRHAVDVADGADGSGAGSVVAVTFHVRVSGELDRLVVSRGGDVLYRGDGGGEAEFWFDAALPVGVHLELVIEAGWGDAGAMQALTLEAQPDGMGDIAATFWGSGEVLDVMEMEIGGGHE